MNQVGNQSTLLIPAVKENNKKSVQMLLKNNVNVNITDSHGKSALHYAIENNNFEIVKALLDSKADMYLKNSTNKIAADHAIEASDKNQTIVKLITEKILEDSIAILKDYEKYEKVSETEKESETGENSEIEVESETGEKSEIEVESETEESPKKHKPSEEKVSKIMNEIEFTEAEIKEFPEEHNHLEKNVYKKIKALSKRLEDSKPSKYKAANTFLIFLEIFCYETSSKISNEIKYLRDTLLKKDNLTPEIIINVIEFCSPEFNSDHTYHELVGKKIQFFIKLAEFLKSLQGNKNLSSISNFFKYENPQQINHVIYSDEVDPEEIDDGFKNKLKSLFSQAYYLSTGLSHYETDIWWEQQWFEFNVNIYPYFIREVNNENKDLIEKEMSHLRDNFILSIEQISKKNWIQNVKEFIIKLKSKLLEYFYAKKLHKRFSLTSPSCADYNHIKDNVNKDLESIRDEFENDIWRRGFASYFEKSLFPMDLCGDVDRALVTECFYFIPVIEYLNENVRSKISYYCNNVDGTETVLGSKLLDDRSRRCFFEQYIKVERCEERMGKVNYILEREKLINGLSEYSTDKECVENIFKHYLDKSRDVSSVAFPVRNFIENLFTVNKLCIKANDIDIVRFVECLFKDTTDKDLSQMPKAFKKFPGMITNFREEHFGKLTSVNIAGIDVDVKATVVTMFKTFYNAFDEYRIVNNVGDLFKRETFLNTLLHKKESLVIDPHDLPIDYMSPFIVKIILRLKNNFDLVGKLVSEDLMKKLIQYLTEEGCLKYLSNLLAVKFNKFDPYDLLLDFIEKREINVECIHQIFDSFGNIKGCAKVLKRKTLSESYILYRDNHPKTNTLLKSSNDERYDNYIKRIIIPFLKLINIKAKEQFIRTRSYHMSNYNLQRSIKEYNKAREILSISEQIGEQYSNKTLTACHVHCVDRDLLNAVICIGQVKYEESVNFFMAAKNKLDQCTIVEHSEIHGKYKLLRRLIRFYMLKTKMMYDSMEIKQEDNLHESSIVTSFKNLYDEIVSKFCNKRAGFENILHTYQELIDDENYKNLLKTSELLCSEKYFNIDNITLSIVFFIWRKYTAGPRTSSDAAELQNALDILENYVYICKKNSENTDFLKHVATIYKKISLQRLGSNHETQLDYGLKALTRFIMYYNIRKDTPAIFCRNDIEKNILDLLHQHIFKQFQCAKGMDFNFSRLDMLTKVYNLCTQVLTSINDWPTNKKVHKHYLQILEVSADVCQDCGDYYKLQGKPEWTIFYRKAVEHSKCIVKLHELVGNSNKKCCENSIKLIEKMEMALEYYDEAEARFQDILQNNNPRLYCRSET